MRVSWVPQTHPGNGRGKSCFSPQHVPSKRQLQSEKSSSVCLISTWRFHGVPGGPESDLHLLPRLGEGKAIRSSQLLALGSFCPLSCLPRAALADPETSWATGSLQMSTASSSAFPRRRWLPLLCRLGQPILTQQGHGLECRRLR